MIEYEATPDPSSNALQVWSWPGLLRSRDPNPPPIKGRAGGPQRLRRYKGDNADEAKFKQLEQLPLGAKAPLVDEQSCDLRRCEALRERLFQEVQKTLFVWLEECALPSFACPANSNCDLRQVSGLLGTRQLAV